MKGEGMDSFFKFKERGTNFQTELLAGVTTFLTMAYIVFVNPGILSAAGVPFEGAATATALGAALMCLAMGFITNRPLALASGMGLNAVVTFSIIGFQQANVPWQVGMSVIFVEGLIILALVLSGAREAIMNAIPLDLKRAIGVGIGLFITVIGLIEGGIIVPNAATVVSLGDFTKPYVWVTLIGLFAILAFMALEIKGDILWGILVATVAALLLGVTKLPNGRRRLRPTSRPSWRRSRFPTAPSSMAILQIFTPALLFAVFAVMLTDFFDTMGTVISVGEQAGFADDEGKVPGIKNILLVDSAAASVGGLFGASLDHHLHRVGRRRGRGRSHRPDRDRHRRPLRRRRVLRAGRSAWSAAAIRSPTPSGSRRSRAPASRSRRTYPFPASRRSRSPLAR